MPPLLLGLIAWLTVVSAVRPPRLEITFPAQHSWWQVSNTDGLLSSLPVYFQTHNFRIPDDGFLFVTGDSVPDEGYRQSSDASSLVLGGIDPGTHFWKLELRSWNDSSTSVAEVLLHVEVVVDPSDERSPWKYTMQSDERRPQVLVNTKRTQEQNGPSRNSCDDPLPVCYVFSSSAAFDGQRRIWLQIMEGLGAGQHPRSAELQFSVKTFENVVQDAPLVKALRKLNVSLHGLPLEILRSELAKGETSSEEVIQALLESFYRQFPSARHDYRRISALDQPALHQLRPPYAARVWTALVEALESPCGDGIIIFSNSRSVSDELLVLAARLTGARAVIMELANLHPTRVDVDVLLAPSHFAMKHYSVVKNVRALHEVVLSTGVDTRQFAASLAQLPEDEHFVIGYVGRLASEKSLGILLAAMKILSPLCPRCKLRLIGDGPQKAQLKSVAAEWGLLGSSVEFVDGIYNDEPALVRQLQMLHVFASPMFTETLGLAVLEAMSVGLPVVGFISSGTGEFLEDGLNCIAVKKATPASFADALLVLVNDTKLRDRLGTKARHTVTERFSTHTTLEQFARLYERVGRASNDVIGTQSSPCIEEFFGLDV